MSGRMQKAGVLRLLIIWMERQMHELGVVFHIMDSLEKVAGENEVNGISIVVLVLG